MSVPMPTDLDDTLEHVIRIIIIIIIIIVDLLSFPLSSNERTGSGRSRETLKMECITREDQGKVRSFSPLAIVTRKQRQQKQQCAMHEGSCDRRRPDNLNILFLCRKKEEKERRKDGSNGCPVALYARQSSTQRIKYFVCFYRTVVIFLVLARLKLFQDGEIILVSVLFYDLFLWTTYVRLLLYYYYY